MKAWEGHHVGRMSQLGQFQSPGQQFRLFKVPMTIHTSFSSPLTQGEPWKLVLYEKRNVRVWFLPVLWVDTLLTELKGQEMSSEPSQAEPQPLTWRFSLLLGH